MKEVLAVILGGGRGTRLFPLTAHRSKPAVPIGGKYRLIDIPISNCLNSHLRRIIVLTQYLSESLNKHISQTYRFDPFTDAFVSVIAAEQTEDEQEWFLGTADAVRRANRHIRHHDFDDVLILSGDQLYQMDYRKMRETHHNADADITVGVTPVEAKDAPGFGILKIDASGRIVHFHEKPRPEELDDLRSEMPDGSQGFLASMGIYVFKRGALEQTLALDASLDFGKHIIPGSIGNLKVQSHVFNGYWEDVGTIRSYYEANLALCQPVPRFDFYDVRMPIHTHARALAATKIEGARMTNALVSEGSIIVDSEIERSMIGIRSRIGRGCVIRNSLILGADYYEKTVPDPASGRPAIGIGDNSVIENAIIDKNARVGANVRLVNEAKVDHADGPCWYIRDSIVIVPKDTVVPNGTVV
ncbi:MAG: glucose-1-phosphate adenylyltransferase [Vicinamibacteria bacterium]|nr:glucose-1-phosphate adenylyltransferase [Vicinamibacteria bacterium]MBP9946350.1 glucose-1-phosphate adenylyltransferase [Vicinamibacteria bacterium]